MKSLRITKIVGMTVFLASSLVRVQGWATRVVSSRATTSVLSQHSRIATQGRSVAQGPRFIQHLVNEYVSRGKSTCDQSGFLSCRFATSHRSLSSLKAVESDEDSFFAKDAADFESLGIQSDILLRRLQQFLGSDARPTSVQAAAFADIAAIHTRQTAPQEGEDPDGEQEDDYSSDVTFRSDVTIGAETGSGKTLAYLLPLMDDILTQKASQGVQYDYARAIILVPNKELVQQVVRMALPLAGGSEKALVGTSITSSSSSNNNDMDDDTDIVRMAIMPGGLQDPLDFRPFRDSKALGGTSPPVDLVISTPAAIGPLGLKPKNIDMFADIETLVIDEADMLLDGGYIRQLENVLLGFRRADRLDASLGVRKTQHVFVAATLPDMGLRSVDAYLQKKFPRSKRVTMQGMHNARHYGLAEKTVWVEENSKKGRMEQLVDMLQTSPSEKGLGLQGEKVMVFLNSVDDVEGACQALIRAGIEAVPYHAKLSLAERTVALDRFRRYSSESSSASNPEDAVSILVCTDLASRGLDVPGVTAVVQLQFAGNVVAHLHRMGRCGRAGQRTGRGIIFYGDTEKELVQVVQEAEEQQERMVLQQDVLEQEADDLEEVGKVKKAFSRKRGFTKKRKKLQREAEEQQQQY